MATTTNIPSLGLRPTSCHSRDYLHILMMMMMMMIGGDDDDDDWWCLKIYYDDGDDGEWLQLTLQVTTVH